MGISNREINVISVGRLVRVKGFDLLLKDFTRALKKNNKLRLFIVGDGEERQRLQRLANKLSISKRVVWLGGQENPYEYMVKMDAFVLNSRYEGQGIVMLEALSLGLPVIVPKHLEGCVDGVKGCDDMAVELAGLKKLKRRKSGSLKKYNNEVMRKLDDVLQVPKTKGTFIAASGGHLTELLQLESIFKNYDYRLITELDDTTKKLEKKFGDKLTYLPRYSGNITGNLVLIARILHRSRRMMRKFRPDYVVSTGSGGAGIYSWVAKKRGTKIIFIETAASIVKPSKTGKRIYKSADSFVIQNKSMLEKFPKAVYGGMIFKSGKTKNGKYGLVLMGTQPQKFTRLLEYLNAVKFKEELVVQSGHTKIDGRKYNVKKFVAQDEFNKLVMGAKYVITHGGVGSIMTALCHGKPVIVVPRERQYGEHVNDHQLEIATQLVSEKYVLMARSKAEFKKAVAKLQSAKSRVVRMDNSLMIETITELLDGGGDNE
jgi:UDP-N-acetylglucosamine transferase subunit ALG13